MHSALPSFDQILFVALPYLAIFVFFAGAIHRYRAHAFTYSSLSSQFLENQYHFWGMVPFHYGILTVLAGHVVAFLIPRHILLWNTHPLRLYILEVTALAFGLLALVGLLGTISRRMNAPRARQVTTTTDWILHLLLLAQVAGGVYIAVFQRWGSSWFAASAAPYLWSIVKLNPDTRYIAAMPFWVKFHMVNAFLLIGYVPFTRLVHVLVVPLAYLWRRPQVVRWNWDRQARNAVAGKS